MWEEIANNNDIISFMQKIHFFHDSCIKELKYLSGAYVDKNLAMHPINNRRILKIIIQRQFEDISMVELEFEGLKYLKLFPTDDNYTCEIHDSTMILKDDCVYWYDCSDLLYPDLNSYEGVLVCASKVRWRSIDGCMGQNEFFVSIMQ